MNGCRHWVSCLSLLLMDANDAAPSASSRRRIALPQDMFNGGLRKWRIDNDNGKFKTSVEQHEVKHF